MKTVLRPSQQALVIPLDLSARDDYPDIELLKDCADYLGWRTDRVIVGEQYPSALVTTHRGTPIRWSPFGSSDHSADLAAAARLGVARVGVKHISIVVHTPDRRVVQMPTGRDPQASLRRLRVRLVSMLSERRRLRVTSGRAPTESARLPLPYYIQG